MSDLIHPARRMPFEAYEKLDGSLLIVFHHDGRWRNAAKAATTAWLEAGSRRASFGTMLEAARRFLSVLIVFALIGGPTMHLAQPALAAAQTMGDMPCDMTMPMPDAGQGTPMPPCNGLTPDCMKQMGCVVDVALPARLASADLAAPFSRVDYWSAWPSMSGVVRAPEPLPPRTA